MLNDENEAIAEAFLSANPEFSLVPANEVLNQQQIKVDTGNYLKLLPHLHGTDGFFAAVFERKAEATKADKAAAEQDAKVPVVSEIAASEKILKPKAEKPKTTKPKTTKKALPK